jgi:hypothetical protein
MPWSVTITHYTDDYKARGGDWSSNEGPFLFTHRKDADAWLQRFLVSYIEENVSEYSFEKGEMKMYERFFTDFKN